jgi:PPOX class probable F420-dependent enzyme
MRERLSDPRIQEFLATKHVVVLSTIRADGSPLSMPVWFLHDPAALAMISVANTQKVRNLRGDPRVCVVAEAGTLADAEGVILEGRAEFLSESAERRELARAFLARYHPHLARIWGGESMPADRVMFRIVPDRVRSWGLPAGS